MHIICTCTGSVHAAAPAPLVSPPQPPQLDSPQKQQQPSLPTSASTDSMSPLVSPPQPPRLVSPQQQAPSLPTSASTGSEDATAPSPLGPPPQPPRLVSRQQQALQSPAPLPPPPLVPLTHSNSLVSPASFLGELNQFIFRGAHADRQSESGGGGGKAGAGAGAGREACNSSGVHAGGVHAGCGSSLANQVS